MHPDPRFHWADHAAMRAFVNARAFGTLVIATPDGPRVAHVPVLFLDEARLCFHLARRNDLVPHLEGARALVSVLGEQGYISPDWYDVDDQVPTWNYETVEVEGACRATDDAGLLAILDALSAEHEQRLAPKPVWTRAKMTHGLVEKMSRGIVGYTIDVDVWRGTRKLGQNKPDDVRLRTADALDATGQTALAAMMRAAGN